MKPGFRSNAEILSVVALDDCNRGWRLVGALIGRVQLARLDLLPLVKASRHSRETAPREVCSAHDAVERWRK